MPGSVQAAQVGGFQVGAEVRREIAFAAAPLEIVNVTLHALAWAAGRLMNLLGGGAATTLVPAASEQKD